MTREERVSVINPTYYRNERLAEAIESVLRQNYLTRIFITNDSGENHAESVTSKYQKYDKKQILWKNTLEQAMIRGLD